MTIILLMQFSKLKIRSASQGHSFRHKKSEQIDDIRQRTRLSVLSTPKKSPSFFRSSYSGKSFDRDNKTDLAYNKWFIHPSRRMKQTFSSQPIDKKEDTFLYRQLYNERYPDPDCPFKERTSQKIKLLEMLPRTNLRCLEGFQKTQLKKHKRVPQIVQMLLSKVKEVENTNT